MARWIKLTPEIAQGLASDRGTPLYVYDAGVLLERVRLARASLPGSLLYAMKANPNRELLERLRGEVSGLDVSSLGEIFLAQRCGWEAEQLHFAGPAKTAHELDEALTRGVSVSLESVRELEAVAQLAAARKTKARVRLRLNPKARVHSYRLPMVGGPSPFGIDEEELPLAIAALRRHADQLSLEGIHVHPGAQCTSVGAFGAAVAATLDLVEHLARVHDVQVANVNFGGGFGVLGPGDELDVEAAGRKLTGTLEKFEKATGLRIAPTVELGRWLVGPSGLYVARVVSEKVSRGQHFVMLDGGMNHHLGATGHLAPDAAPRMPMLNLTRPDAPRVKRTIAGPLCTPLDTFGVDVEVPEPRVGDLIAVTGAGAYGYTFSPLLFLGHPLPAEVVL
jgi:diaminopimelate decarboxylase